MQSKSECQLVAIDSSKFVNAMSCNVDALDEALHYGKGFVQGLSRIGQDRLTDLYTSSLVEGLWFRLMQEGHLRSTSGRNRTPGGTLSYGSTFRRMSMDDQMKEKLFNPLSLFHKKEAMPS